MCESAVHQVTPQPTGRSVADQGELRVSTWPGPAWRQHRPSRSGAPAGTRTRPRQAPGSAACNWAPIRSVRPPARRWVNRPGGQRASPAGKGDRRERHDGEQKHLGAINTTDQLEDRAGPGAVAAGGDPPAQQAEDALDKATAPLPQGPRPRWRPPACRHRDRAPPGPAPGPPLPGRPYSRTGARWACLSADASAAGWGRRASAGGKRACNTSTSVSLTYRRMRIARRRAVIAHPGLGRRGRHVPVTAITSLVVGAELGARPFPGIGRQRRAGISRVPPGSRSGSPRPFRWRWSSRICNSRSGLFA
jgi:hypothetical protein